MASKHSKEILSLYKRILRAAESFPSIKRNDIIQDIKVEFREHKELSDPAVVKQKVAVARRSLEELESYVSMDSTSGGDWSKTLKGSCE